METDDVTLISAFFDLTKYDGRPRRPKAEYMRHGKLLMEVPAKVVFVTDDPSIGDEVMSWRSEYGLADRTKVIIRDLKDLPIGDLWQTFQDLRVANPIGNRPGQEYRTGSYNYLVNCKMYVIEEVVHSNPFGTDSFVWIDFGVHHVSNVRNAWKLLTKQSKFKTMLLQDWDKEAWTTEFSEFDERFANRVACGAMGFDKFHFDEVMNLFSTQLRRVLATGEMPREEQVLAFVIMKRPELFSFYYGQYCAVIDNWNGVQVSHSWLLDAASEARKRGNHGFCHNVTKALLNSYDNGCSSEFSLKGLLRTCDEYFISTWYCLEGDYGIILPNTKPTVEDVLENLERLVELMNEMPQLANLFHEAFSHFNTNLSFYSLPLKFNNRLFLRMVEGEGISEPMPWIPGASYDLDIDIEEAKKRWPFLFLDIGNCEVYALTEKEEEPSQ